MIPETGRGDGAELLISDFRSAIARRDGGDVLPDGGCGGVASGLASMVPVVDDVVEGSGTLRPAQADNHQCSNRQRYAPQAHGSQSMGPRNRAALQEGSEECDPG